jgi:ABC-type glycerol-3-phosphate transport system substrate-binding protein
MIALCAMMAMGAAATPKEITVLTAPFGAADQRMTYAMGKFSADFPDVKLNIQTIDLSDGSTMTMDALLAAGRAPNVYMDTLVRSSKYAVPEFALDLKGLVRDVGKYRADALAPFTKGGKLLALPTPGAAQGICINLDIMDDIGYKVPDKWTTDDFLKMAELVKQKYKGQKWATGMFAANQSGDYLINNWLAAFGAEWYKKGDYSKTTIAEGKGAERTYEFFQTLATKGYIPPGAASLNDDDYAADWAMGKYAATAFFVGWQDGYWKTAIEQGAIAKPFRVAYVPFPRGPGVANAPSYSSYAAIVVHKTGTEQDAWAARFAEYLNDATAQGYAVALANIANRVDAPASTDPYIAQIGKIVAAGGLYDCGLTMPKFAATRPQHFPVLQKVLNLKIKPADAVKEYEAKLNAALK